MKKYAIALIALVVIGMQIHAQSIKVPEAVQKAFAQKFPGATAVKWGMENATEYEAEFNWNKTSISANFKTNGDWVETETVIPVTELPKAVTDAVAKKYPGSVLNKAEKTEQPGGKISYEISFKVNGKKKSVELKADGTSLN
jgi:hypothetical protein